MLNYNIYSEESANKLLKTCMKYKEEMDIDVIWGKCIVDAYSVLGVYSLIGHIVTLDPHTCDKNLLEEFSADLERIK